MEVVLLTAIFPELFETKALLAVKSELVTVLAAPPIEACAPMSERTSEVLLLTNPFAVNLAYSSSAALAESTFTALVLDIPKVKEACLASSCVCTAEVTPSM